MNSNFWAQADADSKALGGHVELAEGVWGNPAYAPTMTKTATFDDQVVEILEERRFVALARWENGETGWLAWDDLSEIRAEDALDAYMAGDPNA